MVFEKIKAIILDGLNVDEDKVTMDALFKEDLGADSLDAVELIMNIEDEFGITVDEETIKTMKCVGDIVKYVESIIK